MLQVFDFELAACSTKVRLTLAELGVPWTRHRIDLMEQEQKLPSYRELNPQMVVPTIVDQGHVLTQADTIMEYLVESRAEASPLRPRDPHARARMRNAFKIIEDFHPSYGVVWYQEVALPFQRRRPRDEIEQMIARQPDAPSRARYRALIGHGVPRERVEEAVAQVAHGFAQVEEVLEADAWLAGDSHSLADIALFPYVGSMMRRVSDLWFSRSPGIRDWFDRMRERPSYLEAVLSLPPTPALAEAIEASPGGGGWCNLV